jgi:antitoxin MazE
MKGVFMRVQIQKWGNSLALRIPKAFVQETHLCQGSTVDIGIKESCIIVKPLAQKKFSLKSLLAGVKKSNIHQEEDFGRNERLETW